MVYDLFQAQSLSIYIGRAVLVLALAGPLAYCSAEESRTKAEVEASAQKIVAELQTACIAQRGDWNTWKEVCEFH